MTRGLSYTPAQNAMIKKLNAEQVPDEVALPIMQKLRPGLTMDQYKNQRKRQGWGKGGRLLHNKRKSRLDKVVIAYTAQGATVDFIQKMMGKGEGVLRRIKNRFGLGVSTGGGAYERRTERALKIIGDPEALLADAGYPSYTGTRTRTVSGKVIKKKIRKKPKATTKPVGVPVVLNPSDVYVGDKHQPEQLELNFDTASQVYRVRCSRPEEGWAKIVVDLGGGVEPIIRKVPLEWGCLIKNILTGRALCDLSA
jgi:hypothetical protein